MYRQLSRFVTVQSLRANIDWKSPFLKGVGHYGPIFQVQGDVPTNHLCTDSECLTTLPLKVFTQRNSVAHFLREKPNILYGKWKKIAFEDPFGGLGATYDVHLRLIIKLVGDFLLVIIELFFAISAFVLSQCTRLTDRRTDRQTDVDSKTVRMLRSRTLKTTKPQ